MAIKKKVNVQNKKIDVLEKEIKTIYKTVYQLSQDVFKLKRVSGSHSKCIGEIREEKICQTKKL